MISSSLVQLLRLRYKSRMRNTLRSVKTLRGALYFSIAAAVFLLWMAPQIILAFHEQENGNHNLFSTDAIEALLPFGLFAYCLLNVFLNLGEKSIYFTPAEIDFLFASPFHRKELLLYKILSNAMTLIFTSLFIAVFTFRFAHHFICVAAGFFLMINFMNQFSMTALLIKQIVTGFAYTRFRQIVLGAAGLLLAAGCWQMADYASSIGWIEAMRRFQSSLAGVIMIGIFIPFAKTMTANNILTEMLPWASIALLLNMVLVYGILQLDANYYERAEAVSQKISQAAQRMKKGQSSPFFSSKAESKSGLSMLPAWGGIGPIVWRQFTTAYRNSKILFLLLPILCITMGPILSSKGMSSNDISPMIMVLVWFSFFVSQMLPFDFRGDLDRMDWLKMLPLNPLAIAIGQLLTPTLVFTTLEFLLFGGIALFFAKTQALLTIVLLFLIPFNFLLFAVDNLFFLVFPVRLAQKGGGDFQHFGRSMLQFFIRMITLFAIVGIAGGIGYLLYIITQIQSLGLIASWILLFSAACSIVPWIALAFERFDPSIHTPAE
ncbi:MAG: hypothetical protein JXR73_18485 [Candidatus Omnitrophica bacterium]|nr:hypothetical protein [Candidatus Omnitrophota bacterium]